MTKTCASLTTLILLFACGAPIDGLTDDTDTQQVISVASFNIQVFGRAKRAEPDVMAVLVQIADTFDIMAIQEIRDSSLETPGVYLDAMNGVGQETHRMVVGPRLGRSSSKEQYAFYYDANVVSLVGEPATYPDTDDVFEREPLAARFASGGIDFVILNVHIKPDDAVAEIDALDAVVEWAVEAFGDHDVIVLGDLNADCRYLNEDRRADLLPLNWITQTSWDTTVKDTDCTYDNIAISDSLLDEFTGFASVLTFDQEYGLTQEFAVKVSDHYPVFATFAVGP